MEAMLSSIVIVIFPPPVVLWANASATADKPNHAATVANATRIFLNSFLVLKYRL
jgi:hypothetical protein